MMTRMSGLKTFGCVVSGIIWWACDHPAETVSSTSGAFTFAEPQTIDAACEACWVDFEVCELTCEAALANGQDGFAECRESCRGEYVVCTDKNGCGEPDEGGNCRVVTSVADIDVPEVRITGTFTVNGAAPMWLASHTGHVELRSETLGTVRLGSLHAGTYKQLLIPGTYDVVYRHVAGTLAPANKETVIATDVVVDTAGVVDVNVPAALVSGTFTLGGGPVPASIYERGEIRFRDRVTGVSFRVGVSNAGNYSALVIPGEYDIVYKRLLGETLVPKNTEAVIGEAIIAGNTTVDIDIPVVERTGAFKIGGVNAPASIYENAQISLRDTVTGDLVALGQTRHQTFAVKVVPGSYDIVYSRLSGTTIVPANSLAVIASGVVFTTSGAADIDISVVSIAGSFTLDGANFPVSIYSNARIWLVGPGDDRVQLGQTRHQTYTTRVIPGTYDLAYEVLLTTGSIPANSWAIVDTGRSILAAKGVRTVDVDVASGWLETAVTYWGGAPFASVYERGVIRATGNDEDTFELLETDDVSSSVRVVAGSYDIRYGHLIGDFVPHNGDAQLAHAVVGPGETVEVAVDKAPGTLSGTYSHNDQPFPGVNWQFAKMALVDVVTKDQIDLARTFEGGYETRLLPGTYDVLYQHQAGATFPNNKGARLGCIEFMPLAP